MEIINSIEKVIHFINRRLSELCGILLFVIMLLLLVNIFSREIGMGIEGLSNISVIVLISVVYLGLSTTEQHKQHASVEILDYRLNKKQKRIVDILVNVIKLGTIAIFLYAAFGDAIVSVQLKESFADVIYVPMWPSKIALLIGVFFFTLQISLNLLKAIFDPHYGDDMDDSSSDLTANL